MHVREPPALVGRDAELAELDADIAAVAGGQFRLTIIEGEAGIGKSRLLEEARSRTLARGFDVRCAAAWELEDARPFGPIRDALAGDFMPNEEHSETQVIDAAVDVLEDLAASNPLALVIDDLQWADPPTLLAVRSAARRLRAAGVWLVLALRPVPRSARLLQLLARLQEEGARQLTLRPLAVSAVGDLVASLLSAKPSPALATSLATAHGNPFYVLELTAALAEEGLLVRADDVTDLTAQVIPPQLRTTILRRLGFLPPATIDALKTACLLGSSFAIADVAAVGGHDVFELTSSLQPALDAGVIAARGDMLAFRHDLVHEALYHDHPLPVRRALHREAGVRLAATGVPATRVAMQMSLGADQGDEEALRWTGRAIVEAFRRSVGVTGEFARRGLDLSVPGSDAYQEFAVWLTSCLYWAGAADETVSEGSRLLAHLSGEAHAKVEYSIAAALEAEGRLQEALPHLRAAVEGVIEAECADTPAFWGELGMRLARAGDFTAADEAVETIRKATRDELPLVVADMVACQVAGGRGEVSAAVEFATAAVKGAARHWQRARFGFPFAYWSQGWALVDADQLDAACESFREGRRIAEARGVASHLPLYQASLGLTSYLAGDLDTAIVESIAGLGLVEELQMRRAAAMMHAVVARARLHLGDVRGAAKAIDTADHDLAGREPEFGSEWLAWARSHVLQASGEGVAALDALEDAWSISAPLRYFVSWRTLAPDLVRSRGTRPADVVRAAEEGAARAPSVASARATALWCRGLLAEDAEVMESAVAAARESPRPLARAGLCEDAAVVLGGERSTELLEEALDIYEAAGAEFDGARVRQAMRAAGTRPRGRGRVARPVSGWGSLTTAESRIAELAGEGLSNPKIADQLYISRRTVQAHLSSVFRKLGLTSRSQLIVELAKRK